jgi:hypothetical protein
MQGTDIIFLHSDFTVPADGIGESYAQPEIDLAYLVGSLPEILGYCVCFFHSFFLLHILPRLWCKTMNFITD